MARCVGWLKECRRLATRHEKLAVNFLAMAKLAVIRRFFKVYDSPERTWSNEPNFFWKGLDLYEPQLL
ncbi:hypothetical protein [Tautonia sociabilis]|uniref:hypothetical protein n=1 Tax=Tautonia sociabilis TaxID=2080755 RepID=UPI001F22ECB3|nr:hypothetical protein [Tautonia sociabilis]